MLQELLKALGVNDRVQITVWDPDDERVEHMFNSVVLDVEGMYFKIAPPLESQQSKIEPLMQPGIVIGVVLEAYPNPFIFYPMIQSCQETPVKGFWLKIPENVQVEAIQRRRHVRIPMELPVEVEYAVGAHSITVKARTEDVSGGGMRFVSPKQFFKDQELLLNFQFSAETPLLRLKARVIFSTENRFRKKPEDVYATACQFFDLEDQQEMLIMRECFRRELGLKR